MLIFDDRSAYEQSIFCQVFHAEESGWRQCNSCDKVNEEDDALYSHLLLFFLFFGFTICVFSQRLHCGCIASRFMMELLDNGGVSCIPCAKKSPLFSVTLHSLNQLRISCLLLDSLSYSCNLSLSLSLPDECLPPIQREI